MINQVQGYRCQAVVHRPATRDYLVTLTHAQGAPFNVVCKKGQALRFRVGALYDFTVHPENFRLQGLARTA
jgi:hypothetical protein